MHILSDSPHAVPPTFRQLEPPERRKKVLRRIRLPGQLQYHLTSSWVLSYLVAAAFYRVYVNAAPGVNIGIVVIISCVPRNQSVGQTRPGEGVPVPFSPGSSSDFKDVQRESLRIVIGKDFPFNTWSSSRTACGTSLTMLAVGGSRRSTTPSKRWNL